MNFRTRILTARPSRIIFLVVILAALTPLFLQTENETHAQTQTSAVSDAPALKVVSASATAVELSWTPVADAVSYQLRAWWPGAGGWQRIHDGSLTGASHTHQTVTAGRKYFYIVAGLDGNGLNGPWSAPVDVTVPGSDASTPTPTFTPMLSSASTPTPTPTLPVTATPTPSSTQSASGLAAPALQAAAGPGRITLNWGAVANADSYLLIVWDPAISDWVRIGGVLTGTSYTHGGLAPARPTTSISAPWPPATQPAPGRSKSPPSRPRRKRKRRRRRPHRRRCRRLRLRQRQRQPRRQRRRPRPRRPQPQPRCRRRR